tara:strand:+ start:3259 stop:4125 length:867 start_codon:yes stop_codon:yes gene_type:complete
LYKNRKIILFAFASKDLSNSASRLKKQAEVTNYYDEIKILSPDDFDQKMQEKFKEITHSRKNRGYGYWFWKPFFLKFIMSEINENDIIHYVDIGCHIQNKNTRFYEYLDFLIENNEWILSFQYFCDKNQLLKDISFSKREEYKYTKADLFDHFNFLGDKNISHSPQFWAGSFFLKKHTISNNFLNEWIDIFEKKMNLIDDSASNVKNYDGFIENRHDQSVFSLLCKKYNVRSMSAYECEWGEKNNQRTWEHNLNNPILAKRDLKYNIFRRFINRQIKTFKRYKKKLIK